MSNANWQDNALQFPRLLAEIMANCDLDMVALAEAMDLSVEQLSELFDRADQAWENIKKGQPADLAAILREGKIGVVPDPMDGWVARSFGDATKFIGRTPTEAAERCWAASQPQATAEAIPASAGQFVQQVFTENTGGGCMVDLVVLNEGRVIGITDESVVLYPSMNAFYEGDADGAFDFPSFERKNPGAEPVIEQPKLGTYVDALQSEYTVDLLTLTTGELLGIDAESICLYASEQAVMEASPDSVLMRIALTSNKSHSGSSWGLQASQPIT